MAKFRIIQANFTLPREEDPLQIIWEGEADTLQFSSYENLIARPMWMSPNASGGITVCFPYPNNISIRKGERGTIWCEKAIDEEGLRELKEANEKQKEVFTELVSS